MQFPKCKEVVLKKEITTPNFNQKEVSRFKIAGKDYSYTIWRRFENHYETWLCVMWHKNWNNGRKGSDNVTRCYEDKETGEWVCVTTYLREDVEKWALDLLHHAGIYSNDKEVHEDFELLANDSYFLRLEQSAPQIKRLVQDLFK